MGRFHYLPQSRERTSYPPPRCRSHLWPFSLLSAALCPALTLVVPFPVAVEAFDISALVLALFFGSEGLILDLALALAQEALLILIGRNSDDGCGSNVRVGDVARGGEGVNGGVVGGG